jgi:hypothetical protein
MISSEKLFACPVKQKSSHLPVRDHRLVRGGKKWTGKRPLPLRISFRAGMGLPDVEQQARTNSKVFDFPCPDGGFMKAALYEKPLYTNTFLG